MITKDAAPPGGCKKLQHFKVDVPCCRAFCFLNEHHVQCEEILHEKIIFALMY